MHRSKSSFRRFCRSKRGSSTTFSANLVLGSSFLMASSSLALYQPNLTNSALTISILASCFSDLRLSSASWFLVSMRLT